MGSKIPLLFWAFVLMTPMSPAWGETGNPDPGPRNGEEAAFLLKEGKSAVEKHDRPAAIRSYLRFVERYPSHSGLKDAYFQLVSALMAEGRIAEAYRHAGDCLNQPWETVDLNRMRSYAAEAKLKMKDHLHARVLADELLKSKPDPKQTGLARSIRFQSLLEDKQFESAEEELDRLEEHLKSAPDASLAAHLPGYRMVFSMRHCTLTHLLKDKAFDESELLDYFGQKNLCFKSALTEAQQVTDATILKEWCESFTGLNHEIEKMRIDSFLKVKIRKDLKTTFEFSKGIHAELEKCYRPYQPKKSDRSRRIRKKA